MRTIDEVIKIDDQAICENIEDLEFKSRDKVSQNMLSFFRNFVEHIAVKIYAEIHPDAQVDYNNIPPAIEYLKTSNDYFFLRKFHGFLQESRSHYTPDNDGAERLLLKYYEYLLQIKNFMQQKYNMVVLHNLELFPIDQDETLQKYYEKIVEKLKVTRYVVDYEKRSERFYVQKSKAFFVKNNVYYEATLVPANDESSKFNRLVVFSKHKITTNYAIKIGIEDEVIEIEGKFMPIKILVAWSTSIRPCELINFAKVFNKTITIRSNMSEYIGLMNYLSKTGINLVEVLECSDRAYEKFKREIAYSAKTIVLCSLFDEARKWIVVKRFGSNTVRYLLYGLNNKIIKLQLSDKENYRIQGLFTNYRTLPFEEMPFDSGLVRHNPSTNDLLSCIGSSGHEHELLAHRISVNTNSYGKLYTKMEELENFQDIGGLIRIYNNSLYKTHQDRRLEVIGTNVFIRGYESDTYTIIKMLIDLAEDGVKDYGLSVDAWLNENATVIDCEEKRQIIRQIFDGSKVAMIYGAAGTGKSTLINHISLFWQNNSKLYLANTNPAVENLKRKVKAGNTEFMTIRKYINSSDIKSDILFIDECSMVSNRDMVEVLKKGNFKLLVLVGDVYQIEAIQFGNWFSLARTFVPLKAQYELTKPYRTTNKSLLDFWAKVRNYKDDIAECLVGYGYTSDLDESIFEAASDDEIVLCLNYDGLYGINNINRFLQSANQNKAVSLGVWLYKVGDPILFNESSKYENVLYNNLKGRIVNIEETDEEVFFSVEIEKKLNGMHVLGTEIELLPNANQSKSIVRFPVKKKKIGDDDGDENDLSTNVPFQIAYAVSIHKAQGLEYNSVKIVITKEIDEMITHNIFYTAVTRAKKNLKIYWTAESQQKILGGFVDDRTSNDAVIFAARKGLKAVKRKK